MNYYENAVKGLRKMANMQIGLIICSILSIIPVINVFAAIAKLVFLIIFLVGLHQAGKDIEGCAEAFTLYIILMICALISGCARAIPAFSLIISIIIFVLSLLVVYRVCIPISELLEQKGKDDIAELGRTTWVVYIIATVSSVLITVVMVVVPFSVGALLGIELILTVIDIIATGFYVRFLDKSANALEYEYINSDMEN